MLWDHPNGRRPLDATSLASPGGGWFGGGGVVWRGVQNENK